MLAFGSFALAEYQTYGIGAMEVGTFYALCKIYLSLLPAAPRSKCFPCWGFFFIEGVGKYIGRLSNTFVNMQQASRSQQTDSPVRDLLSQAIVSLRDVAALLNQTCQRSQRQEAGSIRWFETFPAAWETECREILRLSLVVVRIRRRWQMMAAWQAVRLSRLRSYKSRPGTLSGILRFQDNLCFMRPEHFKASLCPKETKRRNK